MLEQPELPVAEGAIVVAAAAAMLRHSTTLPVVLAGPDAESLLAKAYGRPLVVVHVKDQKTDKSTKFKIVGSAEADPSENKLSNESPVGRALIGHKRGETVSVQVPRGPARKLKITKIER